MTKNTARSKHLASISLAVMGAGFVATTPFVDNSIWIELLNGGFEAGLVGGLADWFAVTALFRHPLGLPIPHTALLPKNRQRMTDSLVNLVENNWLSKESIQNKVQQLRFTDEILSKVEEGISSVGGRKGIVSLSEQVITQIPTEKLVPYIEKELKSAISGIDMTKILHKGIDWVLSNNVNEKTLDFALLKAEEWIRKDETSRQLGHYAIKTINNMEPDGIMQYLMKSFQSFLNEEKLGDLLQNLITSAITTLKSQDDSNRIALLAKVQLEIEKLKDNQSLIDRTESLKEELLAEWQPQNKIAELLEQLKQKALNYIQTEDYVDTVLKMSSTLVQNIKEDESRKQQIEGWIHQRIGNFVEQNHSKISLLVRENLDKLDNEKLTEMIETNVGKDLQWIRVNGAVCGFVIGLILTSIQTLI